MTNQGSEPRDRFDAFETRLANRINRHAEHGVRPIDAGAIARQAAIAGGGHGLGRRVGAGAGAFARVGWLLVGAAFAAGAIGGASWAGSHGLLGAVETPPPSLVAIAPTEAPTAAVTAAPTEAPTEAPTVAPSPTVAPIGACIVARLRARVTAWSGAAGNRVATIVLTNGGTVACKIQVYERPQLVDGNDTVLIDGAPPVQAGSITIAAGGTVTTQTDASNYCGPTPKAPVTVAFVFSSGLQLVAVPLSPTDTFGLPECMGAGSGASITMHPWAP